MESGRLTGCNDVPTLRRVNKREAVALAESLLSDDFIEAQYQLAVRGDKTAAMWLFWLSKPVAPLLRAMARL